MNEDKLTTDDFAENDLPQRPPKYCPEYRTDVRRFVCLCCVIAAVLLLFFVTWSF